MMLIMPSIVFASRASRDSFLIQRIYDYPKYVGEAADNASGNFYVKLCLHTIRRNPTLMFVPQMFEIANGERDYIGEMYGRITYLKASDYSILPQVTSNTFRYHFRYPENIQEMITPNIYGITIFKRHLLSPFNRCNKWFYLFRVSMINRKIARISFRPKLKNTQLVKGIAYVDIESGRVINTMFNGEFDMMDFYINVRQGQEGYVSLLPVQCNIAAEFKFLGNKLRFTQDAIYDNVYPTLPDTLKSKKDILRMDSLRVDSLSDIEKNVYANYEKKYGKKDLISNIPKVHKFSDFMFDLGDELINSHRANFGQGDIRLSPIIDPFAIGYSHRKGLSYQMDFRFGYNFNTKRYFRLRWRFGYNFRLKQMYFTAPLVFNYNNHRNGYISLTIGNGNRLTNSTISDQFQDLPDTLINKKNLEFFDDNYIELIHSIDIFKWWTFQAGFIYHRRNAISKETFRMLGLRTRYESLAPKVTFKFRPWLEYGPTFTANYERGLKNREHKYSEYERWEFDAVYKFTLMRLRTMSFRLGGGFYTNKSSRDFVDYDNFRDNNLPEKWNDDWSGQFQLLDRYWYNSSTYYTRSNLTFESPILVLSWLPYFGRFVEMERVYCNTLFVDKLHPYTEVGYGFTNRFLSIAGYTSFLKNHFEEFGCKFTFELFSRW